MRKAISIIALLGSAIALAFGGPKVYQEMNKAQSGILIAFDDYSPQNWEEHFGLFEKYDAKVTFFVNVAEMTDFCVKAVDCGHEIGLHTVSHVSLPQVSAEEVFAQAIAPIETFKAQGYELTSFAYPYGAYTEELNAELLNYYNVLRGAYHYQLTPIKDFKKGFVESKSIDNINYSTEEEFRADIDFMLQEASQNKGTVVSLYSHSIGDGAWCVSADRLEYILEKGTELGLTFYTYKDLQ